MIRVGSEVYILPSASLRFGGRLGVVSDIQPHLMLPAAVLFAGDPIPYHFDEGELVTRSFYERYKNDPTFCPRCGENITGQFIAFCELCTDPIYKEDTPAWPV